MNCPLCNIELVDQAAFCPRCGSHVDGAPECEEYTYEAFISYRHLPHDREIAVRIQKAIEGYRIPKQLVDETGRQRLGKCFRDEDELPTSASLSDQIEDALKHSRYLIVICTKSTDESLWVQREVELFASYHSRDRILIALAEGEPDESFPPLLLTRYEESADGSIVEVPREPIGADFRDLSRAKFETEKLRIIASLIGCNFDDLRQRAKSRRNKVIASIASVVTAVSLAFGGVSTYQQMQISESLRQIQIKESEFLATEANDLLTKGDRYQAVQVALAGLPLTAEAKDRPYVPAAQMALEQSLGIYPTEHDWQSCYSQSDIAKRSANDCIAYSDNGLEAFVNSSYLVETHETATGNLVAKFDAKSAMLDKPKSEFSAVMEFADDKLLIVFSDAIGCFDAHDGSLLWKLAGDSLAYGRGSLTISPDAKTAAVVIEEYNGMNKMSVQLVSIDDGSVINTFDFPGYEQSKLEYNSFDNYSTVKFSPDGTKLLFGSCGIIYQIDVVTGSSTHVEAKYEKTYSLDYLDGLIVSITKDQHGQFLEEPTSLDVYDANLEHLWSYEAPNVSMYDSSGSIYFHVAKACGIWSYAKGDDRQLVYAFDRDILFLDKLTGERVFAIECDKPIVDCTVAHTRGLDRIFACQGDGTLMIRNPHESNSGKGGGLSDTPLGTGMVQYADLVVRDDHLYCSLVTDAPVKRMVYRFTHPQDFIENAQLNESYGIAKIKLVAWTSDYAMVRGEDAVAFIDPTTFDLVTRVDLKSIDTLDLEDQVSIEAAFDDAGNLYLLGSVKKEAVDDVDRMGVYRINYPDGTVEPLFTLKTSSLYFFDVATLDDGTTQVLATGCAGAINDLLVISTDAETDDRLTYDIVAGTCWQAWYAQGRFLTCINDFYASGEYILLFDPASDAPIECDLSRYTLSKSTSRERGITFSPDMKKVAMACSDGYLRLFDTKTGSLIWETSQTSPLLRFIMFGESGDIFVQDTFNHCVLVSGLTGQILKASSTTLPPIIQGTYREGTNQLNLHFSNMGLMGSTGLVIVSMDHEMFGPSSIIYSGVFVSKDEQRFTYTDPYTDNFCSARKLSLDELIVLGHEQTIGHELTDSEKQLYQVAD